MFRYRSENIFEKKNSKKNFLVAEHRPRGVIGAGGYFYELLDIFEILRAALQTTTTSQIKQSIQLQAIAGYLQRAFAIQYKS